MQRILQRLLMAASDSQLRQDMNVEDEYFSAIETRDTAIMTRDEKIKQLDAQLEEKNSQLEEKNSQLATSVRMLHDNGLSVEQISVSLGMSSEAVRKILA